MALTPSRSRPGEFHTTDLQEKICTCEDFVLNKKECWHMKQMKLIQKWAQKQAKEEKEK
jgi:hypothetical protein